jgi:DNA-binding NarL/FixJ family response regulator
MEEQKQNLYILEENTLSSANLMNFLNKRFDQSLNISIFIDGESLLKKIDAETAIVILDYDLKGEKADKLLLNIKKINSTTEVIILSSDEEIGIAIDAYRKGARNFLVKGKSNLKQIHSIVYRIMYYPVKIIQRFFGFKELLAIFIVEVLYIGVFVLIGMTVFYRN